MAKYVPSAQAINGGGNEISVDNHCGKTYFISTNRCPGNNISVAKPCQVDDIRLAKYPAGTRVSLANHFDGNNIIQASHCGGC